MWLRREGIMDHCFTGINGETVLVIKDEPITTASALSILYGFGGPCSSRSIMLNLGEALPAALRANLHDAMRQCFVEVLHKAGIYGWCAVERGKVITPPEMERGE
jgi:hypothetical protein